MNITIYGNDTDCIEVNGEVHHEWQRTGSGSNIDFECVLCDESATGNEYDGLLADYIQQVGEIGYDL